MGGRGTYAVGKTNTPFTYKTVGRFHGIKVLQGIEGTGKHNLPEEAHSSEAYAKLFKDGSLQMLRFYDKDKHLTLEIGFHKEPKLTGHNNAVYHAHDYTHGFIRSTARFLTPEEVNIYGKYLTQKGHLR